MTSQLRDARLSIDALFLDANNIRYAAIDTTAQVPEERIQDPAVQRKAFERIMQDQFDVRQIKKSIQTSGYFPVDRLIVVELPPDDGKYVVVEGNRRLAAMKSLLEDEASGEISLTPEVKATIVELPCVVVDDVDREARYRTAHILQGIRHISSIKDWVPYAKAQLIPTMEADGRTLKEIRESLGLSTQAINVFRRVLAAMNQMRADPEYGEFVRPRLWGHFEEALKKPEVRKWLDWDDTGIKNDERRETFFAWLVGIEENGERLPPKIPDARDFRYLPAVIEDDATFQRFREDPKLSVEDASKWVHRVEPAIDWRSILAGNVETLKQVPAVELEDATEADRKLIEEVKALCDLLIRHMEKTAKA